jgi:large conductance mechanosensitive channel
MILFIFIRKFLGWILRSRREVAKTPPLTKDQELLSEIRDLLKARAAPPSTAT